MSSRLGIPLWVSGIRHCHDRKLTVLVKLKLRLIDRLLDMDRRLQMMIHTDRVVESRKARVRVQAGWTWSIHVIKYPICTTAMHQVTVFVLSQ